MTTTHLRVGAVLIYSYWLFCHELGFLWWLLVNFRISSTNFSIIVISLAVASLAFALRQADELIYFLVYNIFRFFLFSVL